jgi:hypothetical protein
MQCDSDVLKWFKDKGSPNGKRKMADGTNNKWPEVLMMHWIM